MRGFVVFVLWLFSSLSNSFIYLVFGIWYLVSCNVSKHSSCAIVAVVVAVVAAVVVVVVVLDE